MRKKIFLFLFILIFLRVINFYYKSNKINVILIIIDALRWDHLGCLGYDKDTSPTLDYLAENGVLFTQVITQGNWTTTSMPSILTASYPLRHRVIEFGQTISNETISIAEILKKMAIRQSVSLNINQYS